MLIDLILGILAVIITGLVFGTGTNGIFLIVFGALAAVSVDLDAIIYRFWYGHPLDHFAHEHEDMFHYPMFVSVLGSIVIAIFSVKLCFVWFLATMFHFIHDTLEGGWGVRWAYPFWNKYITLKQDGPRPKIIMTKQEQREIAAQYGNPEWIANLLQTKRLCIEITILALSIVAAMAVFNYY